MALLEQAGADVPVRKRFEVEIPDGMHLDRSRDADGAYRGTLRSDETNTLATHANMYEVDEDEDDDAGDLGALLALTAVAGAGFVTARGLSRFRESRSAKKAAKHALAAPPPQLVAKAAARALPPPGWCEDPAGRVRWWDGQQWTEHTKASDSGESAATAAGTAPTAQPAASTALSPADRRERATMSSAEWQERARAMLIARAFSDEQRNLLANARIEDADAALLAYQRELRSLTPQQFSDRIGDILERRRASSPPAALTPSGWYDDGSGDLRWWDSEQWTHHVHRVAIEVSAQAEVPASAPAGWYDDGSGRQRWWNGQHWA